MHVQHAHVLQIFGKQKISFIKILKNNLLPCKQNIFIYKTFLVDATPVAAGFAVATATDVRCSSLPLTNDGL
jgi:hypothetical protein